MKISICSNYSCLSNETLHPMIIVLHEDIYVGIIVTSAKSLFMLYCILVRSNIKAYRGTGLSE